LVTAFFGATSDQLVILDGPGLLAEAAAAPAHIGTYALAEIVDEGAHIAGYALPVSVPLGTSARVSA
jgi:hypothetical protein